MDRKPKPYMIFETKEEFNKNFDQIFNSGRDMGFLDGLSAALSYLMDVQDKLGGVDENVLANAAYIQSERHKQEFAKQKKLHQAIAEKAVEDYRKEKEYETDATGEG